MKLTGHHAYYMPLDFEAPSIYFMSQLFDRCSFRDGAIYNGYVFQ